MLGAAFFLGGALWTYSVEKMHLPIMLIAVLFFHWQFLSQLARKPKGRWILGTSLFIGFLFAFPVYYTTFAGEGNSRFNNISIFQRANPITFFISNLMDHLSPRFLFFQGDSHFRYTDKTTGQAFQVLILPLIAAFYFMFKDKNHDLYFLLALFLLGIIPACFTTEDIPNALRTIPAVPFIEIIAAWGLVQFIDRLKSKKRMAISILAILFVFNTVHFSFAYFKTIAKNP